jgi:DNA topoisomerase-3
MRLFIAEKPSLARAIADVLPGPQQKRAGYIECGRDDAVTWCAGHILELAEPEDYRPEYKVWATEHLLIVPSAWKLKVSAPDLLKTIQGLLPRAREVVHAGDPDREGQLLVDEVLEHLRYRGPVSRILVSDLNPRPSARPSALSGRTRTSAASTIPRARGSAPIGCSD